MEKNNHQALYRKWRPSVWDEVKYQEHVVQTLKNAIAADKVAHAYIFSGPRGTGKTTAARLLAKAVNCLNSDHGKRPCDECENCVSFNKTQFIDLFEIDAASHTGVDDARDLIEKVGFLPSVGKYKIYIIDEVHMLSKAAFNALLKTIEEPPPHVIFILATTELDKVMPTILSRCQRFEFKRFPLQEISEHLAHICKQENIEADTDALISIARNSAGGMRDAISLLDQLGAAGEKITIELVQRILGTATNESVIQTVDAIIAKDATTAINIAHEVLNRGASAQSFARQITDYLRGVMLVQTRNGNLVDAAPNTKEAIERHAASLRVGQTVNYIKEFNTAITENKMGWSPSLIIELTLARIIAIPEPVAVQPQMQATATSQPNIQANLAGSGSSLQAAASPAQNNTDPKTGGTPTSEKSMPVGPLTVTGQQPKVSSQTDTNPAPPSATVPPVADTQVTNAAQKQTIATLSPEQVKRVWQKVEQQLHARDKNYLALFRMGRFIDLQQNVIVIGFASDILATKFDQHPERAFIVAAFSDALNTAVELRSTITTKKNELPPHLSPDGMVAQAIELGGKLIS